MDSPQTACGAVVMAISVAISDRSSLASFEASDLGTLVSSTIMSVKLAGFAVRPTSVEDDSERQLGC